MRFPRLSGLFQKSGLFHKRSRSDTALAVLPSVPLATPDTRPASTGAIHDFGASSRGSSDIFVPYVPAVPLSITGLHGTPVTIPQYVQQATPQTHPQSQLSLVLALTKRIHDLEVAAQAQSDAKARTSALEAAFAAERAALHAARETNARLTQELHEMQRENHKTCGELYVALSHSPSAAADERISKLAAENTALVAERARHHRFIELMISVGAHKPVLDQAYRDLVSGKEPEAALVSAIKEAIAQPGPDNVWRELLEPVVGQRSPEDYLAQVRCTLSARRETREWRKRAKFWKGTATEGGTRGGTITPSPSDISSIMEEFLPERQKPVDELMKSRRNACYIMGGKSVEEDSDTALAAMGPAVSDALSAIPKVPSISEVAEYKSEEPQSAPAPILPPRIPTLTSGASFSRDLKKMMATPSLATLPAAQSASTVRAYGNLPPLASQTFRESYSIKSIASRAQGVQRVADLISPSRSTSSNGRGQDISASASSSQESTKPRSKAKTESNVSWEDFRVAEPHSASPPPNQSASSVIDLALAARATASASKTSSIGAALAEVAALFSSRSARAAGNARATTSPVPPSTSGSSTGSDSSAGRSSGSAPSSTPTSDGEGAPVLLMPSHPSTPPQAQRPRACTESGARASPSGTPVGTPEKKSRLPVLTRAVRRLSISRPVLVDTTNAATFGFPAPSKPKGKYAAPVGRGKGEAEKTPEAKMSIRGKGATKGRPRAQTTPERSAPVHSSKIPMGRKIKRFSRSSARNAE